MILLSQLNKLNNYHFYFLSRHWHCLVASEGEGEKGLGWGELSTVLRISVYVPFDKTKLFAQQDIVFANWSRKNSWNFPSSSFFPPSRRSLPLSLHSSFYLFFSLSSAFCYLSLAISFTRPSLLPSVPSPIPAPSLFLQISLFAFASFSPQRKRPSPFFAHSDQSTAFNVNNLQQCKLPSPEFHMRNYLQIIAQFRRARYYKERFVICNL